MKPYWRWLSVLGAVAWLLAQAPGVAASPVDRLLAARDILWDQPLSTVTTSAYVDQAFPDFPTYSSYLADDFNNAGPWSIEGIFVPGDVWNGATSLTCATSLHWAVYADAGGLPSGYPSGGDPPVWSLSLPPGDPQVTLSTGSGGYTSNALLTLATPIQLAPGTYWLFFYPEMSFASCGQYGRQPSDTTNLGVGQFINPGGGFGYGTGWQAWTVLGVTQQDIAFQILGAVSTPTPTFTPEPPTETPTAEPTAEPTFTPEPPTETPEPTGTPFVGDLLIPFWQHGYGEQTFFSFYNSPLSDSAVDLTLMLFDENGGFLDSAPPALLGPGETFMPDTMFGGWYDSGDHFGGAVAHVEYADQVGPLDALSGWAAVYADAFGVQPGFTVPVPESPFHPPVDREVRSGSGRLLIPYWEKRGTAVTFYSLWNSPHSANPAACHIVWRLPDGTQVGEYTTALDPGEIAFVETVPPYVPEGAMQGVGEITLDFGPGTVPEDQMHLWSTVYGMFYGYQVGFPVALELPAEPIATPQAGRSDYQIQSRFWQSGWELNTMWSLYNAPDSAHSVTAHVTLYDASGLNPVDESDPIELAPGQGGLIDTAGVWYDAGWNMGVVLITLSYADPVAPEDLVGIWSAVYSDPQPGDARPGFTVVNPGSPVRPWNLNPLKGPAALDGLRHGAGTMLVPFWQNGFGDMSTFWCIWNSPSSPEQATVHLRLRDAAGALIEEELALLNPGQAWLLDTQESWCAVYNMIGAGEIVIEYPTPDDPANQISAWEAVYGIMNGYQVGYPVELR